MGYAAFLQDLLRSAALPVHITTKDLGQGAGDPLARVEMAVRHLAHLRSTRIAPEDRFILLDFDQVALHRQRAESARDLASENKITIIWQRPCFEALLLRHLPNCAARQPPSTLEARRALIKVWPDYQKPMARAALSSRIDHAAVLRAAAVEPELEDLIRNLGLIQA